MNQQSNDHQVWEAARYISNFLARWGRISIADSKEKFGYVRIYCYLGGATLSTLLFPTYGRSPLPRWLWKFDCDVISKILGWQVFDWPIRMWHEYIYHLGYQKGIKKYPKIREAILQDADYPHLLKGL